MHVLHLLLENHPVALLTRPGKNLTSHTTYSHIYTDRISQINTRFKICVQIMWPLSTGLPANRVRYIFNVCIVERVNYRSHNITQHKFKGMISFINECSWGWTHALTKNTKKILVWKCFFILIHSVTFILFSCIQIKQLLYTWCRNCMTAEKSS